MGNQQLFKVTSALLIVLVALATLPVTPSYAATITVNTITDEDVDNGNCSLREAVIAANTGLAHNGCPAGNIGADTITLASGSTYTLSIGGTLDNDALTGDLDILDPLTIQASGATTAIINQTAGDHVIDVREYLTTLTLNRITVSGGNSIGGGGGIRVEAYGQTLTLLNSTISGNTSNNQLTCGAGIWVNPDPTNTINIYESTIANNTCAPNGGDGAGLSFSAGTVNIRNSTFYGNQVPIAATVGGDNSQGGAIFMGGGTLNANFVSFANNRAQADQGADLHVAGGTVNLQHSFLVNPINTAVNCFSAATDTVNGSLIEGNSGVEACGAAVSTAFADTLTLGDFGGPTQTLAIATTTANLYNAASTCAGSNNIDQRGTLRPQGATCDIGAYEAYEIYEAVTATITNADPSPTSETTVDFTVNFSSPVIGVSAADFKLTNTILTGTSITNISGSGSGPYTVTVNTGTGDGTIRLDIPATASIFDVFGNPVGPKTGSTYTVGKGTAPTVPVLVSPANKALVPNYMPTLDWSGSSQVMALTIPGWHYEIEVQSYTTLRTYNTLDNADPDLGLGASQYIFTEPLLPNTTYTWRVRSYNDTNQYSAWSLARTFRTKLATPVLNLPEDNATLNNKRPTFEWDASDGATTYTLQILKAGKVVTSGTIKAPLYTYTPTADLLADTTYTWKVKANGANPGDYSAPSTFTTSPNPPKAPVLSAPANAALVDSAVPQTLKWNPVLAVVTTVPATSYPAAASFEVQYSTNNTFNNISPTNTVVSEIINGNTLAETQLVNPILLPGRTYYWRVRSWSGANVMGNHSNWSLTRMIKVKFVAPTLTSVDNRLLGRPAFKWSSTNGLWTSYTLQVADNNTFTKGLRSFTIKAPITSYTIPSNLPALTPGTKYWHVKINGLYTSIVSGCDTFAIP